MSDARWIEVENDMAAAAEHFRFAEQLFDPEAFAAAGIGGYRARMSFMHAMQAGHTSLESGLLRILDMVGEEAPSGDRWHADLIARAARPISSRRPAILSPMTAAAADETRRFRNVALRSYDSFRPEPARPAVEAASVLASSLADEIASFRKAIDPSPAG